MCARFPLILSAIQPCLSRLVQVRMVCLGVQILAPPMKESVMYQVAHTLEKASNEPEIFKDNWELIVGLEVHVELSTNQTLLWVP